MAFADWAQTMTTLWHIDAGSGGHPPRQAHQTPRWREMDSNFPFRCRLAKVRGFVRVGADLPVHGHPSSCRPRRTSSCRTGSGGAATHRPDQAASHQGRAIGGASASRKQRFDPSPPAASQLFGCGSGGTLRICSGSITEATPSQARSPVAARLRSSGGGCRFRAQGCCAQPS